VKMYTRSVGYWMDASCGEYRPYVCKRRMAPPDGKKFPVTGSKWSKQCVQSIL